MADEPGKRRRGKRGGRGRSNGPRDVEQQAPGNEAPPPGQQPPEPGAPLGGVTPSTGKTGRESQRQSSAHATGPTRRERRAPTAGGKPEGSPMDFWRSGQPRTLRERSAAAGGGGGGIMNRLRHMYFPPWVPVVAIIFVVFGILGLLFVTRSATGAPRIGSDHWHATYTFYACGEKQPNASEWNSGVHTHADGVVHIHPFTSSEEGAGARLVKWFDYGAGQLDSDEIRLPGLSKTWKNGEICPEGSPEAGTEGKLQVFVNSQKLDDWSRYIPKDGDRIRLVFGAEEEFTQLDDRQVIPEGNATRTVEVSVTGDDTADPVVPSEFDPAALTIRAGETVKIVLNNVGTSSHGMRFAGPDGEFDNGDDFVVVPEGSDPDEAEQGDILEPDATGFTVIRFDDAGEYQWKDPTAEDATGTVIVTEGASATPGPDEGGTEVPIVARDNVYEPAELTVAEGERFRIVITNEGEFAHNIRIDGPDGEFETDDDLVSEDVNGGETGELAGQIDEAGTYRFRDDFHPDQTGTLIVE